MQVALPFEHLAAVDALVWSLALSLACEGSC